MSHWASPSRDQRATGVAVGQRTANLTVNVRFEGVDPCVGTDDLTNWPADYRIGVAQGLMFSPGGRCTATTQWIPLALQVIAPVENASGEIDAIFEDVIRATPYGIPEGRAADRQQAVAVLSWLAESSPLTPTTLERLAAHTGGQSR